MKKYIRMNKLATKGDEPGLLPVSAPTIWRWVKSSKFPKPYKLGPGCTVWDLEEVETFLLKKRLESN
jgi:hypothetical protein